MDSSDQIFFSQGNLEISLSDSMEESELQIARRFADVFDIAYRRYGELQQAEAARVQLGGTTLSPGPSPRSHRTCSFPASGEPVKDPIWGAHSSTS